MIFPPSTWRLILTPPAPGAWNMAVDEAILEAVGRTEVPPTLRIYSWDPPCLSLGVAQPVSDVNESILEHHKWDLVRRVTGGRAILHTDELTYAVIGPPTEPRFSGDILGSYRVLSSALLRALHILTIPADAEEKPHLPDSGHRLSEGEVRDNQNEKSQNPVCFEVPSDYEITVDGKKLVGSAQARRKGGVLQHGSLPLYGDLTRVIEVLNFPDPAAKTRAAERLVLRATTVEKVLNAKVNWESAVQAFVSGFEEILNLDLQIEPLKMAEINRAEELILEKYSNQDWTLRV